MDLWPTGVCYAHAGFFATTRDFHYFVFFLFQKVAKVGRREGPIYRTNRNLRAAKRVSIYQLFYLEFKYKTSDSQTQAQTRKSTISPTSIWQFASPNRTNE